MRPTLKDLHHDGQGRDNLGSVIRFSLVLSQLFPLLLLGVFPLLHFASSPVPKMGEENIDLASGNNLQILTVVLIPAKNISGPNVTFYKLLVKNKHASLLRLCNCEIIKIY